MFKKYIFKIENNNHLFLYKFIIAILDIFKSIFHDEFKVLQFLYHELLQNYKKYLGHVKNISALNLQKSKDVPASEKFYWSLKTQKSPWNMAGLRVEDMTVLRCDVIRCCVGWSAC